MAATSKKKDRIENMIQLRNTLARGTAETSPINGEKRISFNADNHKVVMSHIDMMLAQDGIFRIAP